ncbi:MAG TPA: DNA transposition protein [Aliidongia sp.]|nr:DNA transposition protein [Aliidongia sp.]
MRNRHDERTLDLLDWTPPQVSPQVDAELVRAGSLRGRISRAVALVLRDCDLPRELVAERMGEFLGEEVARSSLDGYASQAREEHTISAIRLVALAHVTGDMRALQVLIEPLDQAVIPARYLPAIEAEIKAEQAEALAARADELRSQAQLARRQWKAPRK